MEALIHITEKLIEDLRKLGRGSASAPKILIVEDDVSDVQIMRYTLEATLRELRVSNFTIDVASTAAEASARLFTASKTTELDYSIVFLDLKLPGGSGVGVLRKIKEVAPDLPVVIVTGTVYASNELVEAVKIGYFGLVDKPLQKSDVKEILSKHHITKTGDTERIQRVSTK